MSNHLNCETQLFKFTPFNSNTLKILINGELWFGQPYNQNDPFEGEFIPNGFSKPIDEKVKLDIVRRIPEKVYRSFPYDSHFREDDFTVVLTNHFSDLIKNKFDKI